MDNRMVKSTRTELRRTCNNNKENSIFLRSNSIPRKQLAKRSRFFSDKYPKLVLTIALRQESRLINALTKRCHTLRRRAARVLARKKKRWSLPAVSRGLPGHALTMREIGKNEQGANRTPRRSRYHIIISHTRILLHFGLKLASEVYLFGIAGL
ncbi:hypothetical protein METSCH_F05040 [Metschnikowia aff. pulcherrima]|uniref:Uncharacterized protein n=1 Tax=Metschnikowia aff. pulcherrima TaxID=2163413 RepID=A0A4P6XWD3_9ASCO|nr:hypothetical protein METSCH_F05040 [Metschnikowia aff. pulcherrima]